MQTTHRASPERWALIILTALTFGVPVLLGWYGFFGDDWIYVYNNHLLGPGSFAEFVRWDRPYSAWIYTLTGALFGESVLPYHLLLLAQRIIAVLFFHATLQILLPRARRAVFAASLLFALYPGFNQQPVAVQFILHFASMDFSLISIYLMLRMQQAAQKDSLSAGKRATITVFSALLAAFGLFSCEYFTGWEFVRPFLLFFAILTSNRSGDFSIMSAIINTVKRWFPYLLSVTAFLVWRVLIFSFQTYQPKLLDSIRAEPVSGLRTLLTRVLSDLAVVTVETYRNTLKRPGGNVRSAVFAAAIFISFALIAWLLSRSKDEPAWHEKNEKESTVPAWLRNESVILITIGAVALIVAGVPFWMTLLPIETSFPWDRSTLPFAFGVALLFTGLVSLAFKPTFTPIVFATLISLSVGSHVRNAFVYHDETVKLNDYFWQLAWRVPGLEPGTVVVSADIPLDRTSDNDLSPILNWQYAPELRGYTYAYKYFDLHLRYEEFFANSGAGEPIEHTYRSHQFFGNTDQLLAITYKKGGCLWTLGDAEKTFPGLNGDLAAMIPRSNLNVIRLTPETVAAPPTAIGPEPEHGYCYAFQQLRKAQQVGDRGAMASIVADIRERDLKPEDPFDYIPVVTALSSLGETDAAIEAAEIVLRHESNRTFLCDQLNRTVDDENARDLKTHLACELP